MSSSLRKKRIFLFIFLVICASVLIFLFRNLPGRGMAKKAAGIYMISGGESYLVLESGFWGALKVKEGAFNTISFPRPSIEISFNVKIEKGKLRLNQNEVYRSQYGSSGTYSVFNFEIRCTPGKNIAGDWDLAFAEFKEVWGEEKKGLVSKKFWKDITSSSSIIDFKEKVSRYFEKKTMGHYKWDSKKNPCPSILHRVDDQRVVEYFRMRQEGKIDRKALELVRELARDHPGDPYLELHRIEMEALQADPEIASELLKKWEEAHGAFPDPLLKRMVKRVSQTISIEIARKKYPDWKNPLDIFQMDIFQTKEQNLNEILEYYKRFLSWEALYFIPFPISPPLKNAGYSGPPVPNFLEFQVRSKVVRIMATLFLFQGKRAESLELFTSTYRMGQALNSHGSLIQRLIGIAIRAIASEGLRIFVLNACETELEFQNCWTMLQRLHNKPGQEDGSHLLDDEFPPIRSNMEFVSGIMPNFLEAETRHKVSDMRFQLVRMACAAKYRMLLSGDFPSTKDEFAPFLSEGLPWDSFTEKDPLRFTKLSPNEMAVYSIGPDKDDDYAAINYDPTNGTLSDGDVFITIPREREFPFPREEVRAANAYELLEKFPNGLPADPFADTRGLPLSIIESTDKYPVVVFSFGPNTDEQDSRSSGFNPYAPGMPEMEFPGMKPQMRETPIPTPTPPPITTPDPGPNPGFGRSIQKIYGRSESESPSPGYRYLEPMYDPTNGTVSKGDLFIEIPR